MKSLVRKKSSQVVGTIRWSEARLLVEARKRTKELFTDNSVRVQKMLSNLLKEAGWNEEEFIDALCKDVIAHGKQG